MLPAHPEPRRWLDEFCAIVALLEEATAYDGREAPLRCNGSLATDARQHVAATEDRWWNGNS